ncbi:hypothetical protein D9M71_314530 [compost metagenome]
MPATWPSPSSRVPTARSRRSTCGRARSPRRPARPVASPCSRRTSTRATSRAIRSPRCCVPTPATMYACGSTPAATRRSTTSPCTALSGRTPAPVSAPPPTPAGVPRSWSASPSSSASSLRCRCCPARRAIPPTICTPWTHRWMATGTASGACCATTPRRNPTWRRCRTTRNRPPCATPPRSTVSARAPVPTRPVSAPVRRPSATTRSSPRWPTTSCRIRWA